MFSFRTGDGKKRAPRSRCLLASWLSCLLAWSSPPSSLSKRPLIRVGWQSSQIWPLACYVNGNAQRAVISKVIDAMLYHTLHLRSNLYILTTIYIHHSIITTLSFPSIWPSDSGRCMYLWLERQVSVLVAYSILLLRLTASNPQANLVSTLRVRHWHTTIPWRSTFAALGNYRRTSKITSKWP